MNQVGSFSLYRGLPIAKSSIAKTDFIIKSDSTKTKNKKQIKNFFSKNLVGWL